MLGEIAVDRGQYQPSKAVLFWACVGSAILAMVVGFSWGWLGDVMGWLGDGRHRSGDG